MPKLFIVVTLAALIMVAAGCDDDPASSIEMATVIIDPTPGNASVTWRLEGVTEASGSGGRSVSVYPGRYVMRWIPNEDWVNVTGEEYVYFEVQGGDTYRLESTFFEDAPATVVIDVTPDDTPSIWYCTAADGTLTTGVGDAQFQIDHSGPVDVLWQGTDELWAPVPSGVTQMALGNTVTFEAVFQPRVDDEFDRGVILPVGSYFMGSPEDELAREGDETLHEVAFTYNIVCDQYEVSSRSFLGSAIAASLLDAARLEIYTTSFNFDTYRDTVEFANNPNAIVIVDHSPNAMPGATPAVRVDVFDLLDGNTGLLQVTAPSNISVNVSPNSGDNPLNFYDNVSLRAIRGLTWFSAAAYCDWVSLENGLERAYDHSTWELTGADPSLLEGYRLPTEAEWEYACRADTRTAYASGPILIATVGDVNLERVAWYGGEGIPRISGQKDPNDFGLYDMHGNVWEWCHDWFASEAYDDHAAENPVGPADGILRCVRGGDVDAYARACRSANRHAYDPFLNGPVGFRAVRSLID